MLFPSVSFLFLFLPIVLGCYYILPKCWRNLFLLIASIVFYGWEDWRIIQTLLLVIVVNYFGGLAIARFGAYKKYVCALFVASNIGILGYFKYTNFLVNIFNQITEIHLNIAQILLPLGISFYIFQAISYIVDVYRGECKAQKNPIKFALYISFFPQLIAGPIIKYHEIEGQIESRTESLNKIHYGLRRFAIGLIKKVLIANVLGITLDEALSLSVSESSIAIAWMCTIFYALQIYYDFSGYADMAIGLGAMFGFKIPENFNYPLISKTLTEYWQRWHISLGTWVKYYLYIPLGGSRCAKWRHYLNLFIVFFVIGIWHGASWNFVVFGIYNGIMILFEKITGLAKAMPHGLKRLAIHIYFIIAMVPTTLLGKVETVSKTWEYTKKLFGFGDNQEVQYHLTFFVSNHLLLVFALAIIGMFPLCRNILCKKGICYNIILDVGLLGLSALAIVSIVASSYNPFIYFRF